MISSHPFLEPGASDAALAWFRMLVGLFTCGFLVQALPHVRRFFLTERWGGWTESSPGLDRLQNPVVMALVLPLWFAAAALLAFGWWTPVTAFVNLVLCRHFFVRLRWRGVHRGMGAPGFMTYWTAAAVFVLEVSREWFPAWRETALLTVQLDLALIMLSAGIYKFTAGYPRNVGLELGLINPHWSYWPGLWMRMPPDGFVVRFQNQMAWLTEVVMAIMMLVPPLRMLGGALMALVFLVIALQIRLGMLAWQVMVCALPFVFAGSAPEAVLERAAGGMPPTRAVPWAPPESVGVVFGAALIVYLVLLLPSHVGLYWNFYGRRSLPGPLQGALERWTNFFGIIIWRVFTVDVINFFVRVHAEPRAGGERREITRWAAFTSARWSHVVEAIAMTCVFTTLKYHPHRPDLFRERLLRHAGTLPRGDDEVLVYEYVSLGRADGKFTRDTAAWFRVDPDAPEDERVHEEAVPGGADIRAAGSTSPIHAGARPGSYRPADD